MSEMGIRTQRASVRSCDAPASRSDVRLLGREREIFPAGIERVAKVLA
jgi:hypothetical protein